MIETEKKKPVYTVGQVNSYIKQIFDGDFILKNIPVKGEISNCKYHHSGHIYFSLKDASGVISCVMFSSFANELSFGLEDGMQIVASGNISVYEASGRYQLYVKKAEKEGEGDLFKKYEELKKKLDEEGLFSAEHKKKIPAYAMHIGVVTAETGAVIKDIFNVASRRNPYIQILLYPATVQGDGAADTIVSGIKRLDDEKVDVIIIGRGGGSMEDLWAFNEEKVARAIYECNTPVISAVGHETDFTIADYVADERAPTPSAAAELAVFDHALFEKELADHKYSFESLMNRKIRYCIDSAQKYRLTLETLSPSNMILQKKHKLSDISNMLDSLAGDKISSAKDRLFDVSGRLDELCNMRLNDAQGRLGILSERLSGLSPLKRLSEGYAFVSFNDNKLISVSQVDAGDVISVNIKDGNIDAAVTNKKEVRYE